MPTLSSPHPVLAGIDFTSRPTARKPITVDLRVGGAWRQQMVINAETQYFTGGVYREIVPNERVAADLVDRTLALLADPARLGSMNQAMRGQFKPDAARDVNERLSALGIRRDDELIVVHFSAGNVRPGTKSWIKLELRVSIAFDVEHDFLLCPVVVEVESSGVNAHITYRKGSPARGNVRTKYNFVR